MNTNFNAVEGLILLCEIDKLQRGTVGKNMIVVSFLCPLISRRLGISLLDGALNLVTQTHFQVIGSRQAYLKGL